MLGLAIRVIDLIRKQAKKYEFNVNSECKDKLIKIKFLQANKNNAMQSVFIYPYLYLYMCIYFILPLNADALASLSKLISFIILSVGELDPERMGSGIQYGDTSIRRMPKESLGSSSKRPDCAC